MAIAKIDIICTECGRTFTHRKECHNSREAESYSAWAANNIDTCPECYKKQRSEQKTSAIAVVLDESKIKMPELTGASDKQVAYAVSVRERYLANNISKVKGYCKVQQLLTDAEQVAKFASICEARGMTLEEGIQHDMRAMGLTTVQLMLTSNSAREILDANK